MAEQQQLPLPEQEQAPDIIPGAAENNIQEAGIRNFRPRRSVYYSRADRVRAIKMLENGVSCRQVAKSLGPRCSSGTPIRWRQLKLKQDESRRLMAEMMKRPENAFQRN